MRWLVFEFMAMMKALSDANRVRILCALADQELCVCQIIEMLGLAPSTVSKHLSVLRQARLIDDRKEGRWMYYRRSATPTPECHSMMTLLKKSLSEDAQVVADRKRVEKIVCIDKEALCRSRSKKQS
jgi:DNA-binding transcriptional ArsR family regulator